MNSPPYSRPSSCPFVNVFSSSLEHPNIMKAHKQHQQQTAAPMTTQIHHSSMMLSELSVAIFRD